MSASILLKNDLFFVVFYLLFMPAGYIILSSFSAAATSFVSRCVHENPYVFLLFFFCYFFVTNVHRNHPVLYVCFVNMKYRSPKMGTKGVFFVMYLLSSVLLN